MPKDPRELLDLHVYWKRRPLKVVRVHCDRDDHDKLKEHLLEVMWDEAKRSKNHIDEFEMDVHEPDEKKPEFSFKP